MIEMRICELIKVYCILLVVIGNFIRIVRIIIYYLNFLYKYKYIKSVLV